jgi:prepilin signal peptidase PulO-like enzyme (type II secretory pathway)
VAIFLSALLALPIMIIAKIKAKTIEDTQVAYIPFLLMATVITYFFDTPIHNYITTIYGA